VTSAPSFTCPDCRATSYHPEDIKEQYCGGCHAYKGDCPDCGHSSTHLVIEGCTAPIGPDHRCGCVFRAEI
jgi:hypothetical protein